MHLALVSIQEKLIACVSARALLTFDLFQAPNFHRARPAPRGFPVATSSVLRTARGLTRSLVRYWFPEVGFTYSKSVVD